MSAVIYNYSAEDIKKKISEFGMKCTSQRLVIYKALIHLDHPSSEMVFEYIKKDSPSISLSTIYSTLETFAEKKLIRKINTNKGKMRYDARIENHIHVYDKETDAINDYFDDELQELVLAHLKEKKNEDIKIEDIRILINS